MLPAVASAKPAELAADRVIEASTNPPENAVAWIKSLDLANEAETYEGGMVVRRGYLAESELDLAMLPALHTAGLQHLLKLNEDDSGHYSPVEIAWFEPIGYPGTRCAALLQTMSLTRTPSKELQQGLADYRVKSPAMRLGPDCKPVAYSSGERKALGYEGKSGRISLDKSASCTDFQQGPKERLIISRYTAFAHNIKHNAANVSRLGIENVDDVGRWATIGINSGLNARKLPHMDYLRDGFTIDRPTNVALSSYILDGNGRGQRCVALVATQGSKQWVGILDIAIDTQVSPAISEVYRGGWDAKKPLERLGNELAASLEYSTAED